MREAAARQSHHFAAGIYDLDRGRGFGRFSPPCYRAMPFTSCGYGRESKIPRRFASAGGRIEVANLGSSISTPPALFSNSSALSSGFFSLQVL